MQRTKFKNRHLVKEKKQDVLKRIYEIAGTDNRSEIARQFGITPNAFGNWAGENSGREIPLEFLVDFCISHGASIDYILTGKSPQKMISFTGAPTVSSSVGAQQVTVGDTVGPGAAISNTTTTGVKPEMARLIELLNHYGSPWLYERIEEFILSFYRER